MYLQRIESVLLNIRSKYNIHAYLRDNMKQIKSICFVFHAKDHIFISYYLHVSNFALPLRSQNIKKMLNNILHIILVVILLVISR